MNRELFARITLIGVAIGLLLPACSTTAPQAGPAALTGTWTNSLGTVWTMRADGTFDVDLNHDGTRDAWGTISVHGDMATIEGTGEKIPAGCKKAVGVYHFVRTKNTLHFTLAHDDCKLRVQNMMHDWTMK